MKIKLFAVFLVVFITYNVVKCEDLSDDHDDQNEIEAKRIKIDHRLVKNKSTDKVSSILGAFDSLTVKVTDAKDTLTGL